MLDFMPEYIYMLVFQLTYTFVKNDSLILFQHCLLSFFTFPLHGISCLTTFHTFSYGIFVVQCTPPFIGQSKSIEVRKYLCQTVNFVFGTRGWYTFLSASLMYIKQGIDTTDIRYGVLCLYACNSHFIHFKSFT